LLDPRSDRNYAERAGDEYDGGNEVLGWRIFVHSLRMVIGNWRDVLRIVLVPVLIWGSLLGAFVTYIGAQQSEVAQGVLIFSTLWFVAVATLLVLWVLVAWHRFILLEEAPTRFLPPFHFDRMLAYLGYVLLVSLLVVLPSLALVTPLIMMSQIGVLAFVGMGVVYVCAGIVFFRLSVILPASAIDRPLSLSQAWQATSGSFFGFLILLIVSVVFQTAINWLVEAFSFIPMLHFALSVLVSALLGLINVSILTTLYGVFVEKRELA